MTLQFTTKKKYMLRKDKKFIFNKKKEKLYVSIFRALLIILCSPIIIILTVCANINGGLKKRKTSVMSVNINKDSLNKEARINVINNTRYHEIKNKEISKKPINITVHRDNVVFYK